MYRQRKGLQRPPEQAHVAREIAQAAQMIQRIGTNGESEVVVSVKLSPLGYQRLAAIQRKLGKRRSDVFEDMLRGRAADVMLLQ